MKLYTCPCCGYEVFTKEPGSYEICSVCGWEDDSSQLKFPSSLGANHVPLIEAQGKCIVDDNKAKLHQKDANWRKLDPNVDPIEKPVEGHDYGMDYPTNLTDLYYWNKKQ